MNSIELRTLAVRGKRSLICLVNIESYIMVKDLVKEHTSDDPTVKTGRGIVKSRNTHMSLLWEEDLNKSI